ncbi:MAG: GGDEF domain-containing protein [Thermodesulfovibrionales bacterium]
MGYRFLDVQSLTKAFESLSVLTGLHYSLYDDRLNRLISPVKEDALLSFLKSDKNGQKLYDSFIEEQLGLSLKRSNPFIIQPYTMQHLVVLPINYKDLRLVATAEAFYASAEDFKMFYVRSAGKFGLERKGMEGWLKEITVIPSEQMTGRLQSIHSLIENLISSGHEKDELSRKWRCSRTIVSLMANMNSDTLIKDIYRTIVDAVIFLFNVDTAAVFSKGNESFIPEVAAGRQSGLIQQIDLSKDNQFFSQASASGRPAAVLDGHELWYSGFPEEVVSMYLFPLSSAFGSFGFLGVFNTLLDKEAFNAVQELCMLSSYLCGIRQQKEDYERKAVSLGQVSNRIFSLYSHFREPERLYEGIVSEASELVGAEKCSLMMPEYDEKTLRVFASKGINRWLMGSVRVRPGEGIAGRVYETGEPVLTDREEVILEYTSAVKSHYRTPSSISLPLKVADETIGVLNLSDKYSGEPFSEKDISTLAGFVSQASVLLRLCDYHERSEQMRELSITDPLTGLFNRRYFNIRLDEESRRARRYALPMSLVIMDIDIFKLFNDAEGHLAGDYILKEVASIMSAAVRANDILVRFGGDEFVILMPQTSKAEALGVAERIMKNIRDQIQLAWKRFPAKQITISAGISMFPDCGGLKDHLIRCADRALYKAKMKGRDCVLMWDGNGSACEEDHGAPQKTGYPADD